MAPTFRLFLFETMTGRILADLPYTTTPTWSREISDQGSMSSVNVPLSGLDADTLQMLQTKWRYGMAWSFGNAVMQMGFISTFSVDDTQTPVVADIGLTTLWGFLSAKRPCLNIGFALDDPNADIIFGYTGGDYLSPNDSNNNLSLAGIAIRLVQMATTYNGDPRFSLPMVLPSLVDQTGQNERQYLASDLAFFGDRLTDLVGVINGPEIEFAPRFNDDSHAYVQWEMNVSDRIGNIEYPWAYDYGQALQSFIYTEDGTDMTDLVYAKGQDNRTTDDAGVTTGALVWNFYSDETDPDAGSPWLMTVDTTHDDVTNNATILGYAQGDVQTNRDSANTATGVIRLDGKNLQGKQTGSPSIEQLSVGDTCALSTAGHPWLNANYGVRILSMQNGSDTYEISVTFQILGEILS